jgi:hypothetical protein
VAIEDQALEFVSRADSALADLQNATEIWESTIRSNTQEMRLHSFDIKLDNAIRKVPGRFEHWEGLNPAAVQQVASDGPIHLYWLTSAHPSGVVREAFLDSTEGRVDDHVLPHLANRALDFVPQVRQRAGEMVTTRLAAALAERSGPENHGVLPTTVHIAVTRLLTARTARFHPELVEMSIALAETASLSRPAALKSAQLDRALDSCRQRLASDPDQPTRQAVEALMAYLVSNHRV